MFPHSLLQKLITAVWVLVILAILSVPIVGVLGFPGIPYSEGTRSGVICKFSHKGFIWPTWEGELSLGLTERDAEGKIVNLTFDFSVSDGIMAEEVQKAAESGKRVNLHYKQYVWRGYKYGSQQYDIVGVSYSEEK